MINRVEVMVERISPDVPLPSFGSPNAAGVDLYSQEDVSILPHQTTLVGTGLKFQLPAGTFYGIVARSGLATKEGLRPANCFGVCDSDYRGEYKIALHNDSEVKRNITKGERIAQMILFDYLTPDFILGSVDETERGEGGFGSTGK